jgi:hypothetical protein
MTALVVAIALVVGVLFSEVLLRNAGSRTWAARRLAGALAELKSFHGADNDDARQHHLIRGGMATLTLSLAVLAAIAVCAAVYAAPLLLLALTEREVTIYLVVSAIIAIAWWMLRRARRRA